MSDLEVEAAEALERGKEVPIIVTADGRGLDPRPVTTDPVVAAQVDELVSVGNAIDGDTVVSGDPPPLHAPDYLRPEEDTVEADARQRASWQNSEDHGFHEAQRQMDPRVAAVWVRLMLVVEELTEAAAHLRDGRRTTEIFYHESGKPDGFPIEIADAIIRLEDLAEEERFSIATARFIKAEYNRSRDFMHGRTV